MVFWKYLGMKILGKIGEEENAKIVFTFITEENIN